MKDLEKKLTFTCTDRLGEAKSLEFALNLQNTENEGKTDKKINLEHNGIIKDSLCEFQIQINTLMTEFVNKEKQAVSSKLLSNEHLKKENLKSAESGSESEESNESDEDESSLKRHSDEKEKNEDVSTEKKSCL
jgi:hypothetical protein